MSYRLGSKAIYDCRTMEAVNKIIVGIVHDDSKMPDPYCS